MGLAFTAAGGKQGRGGRRRGAGRKRTRSRPGVPHCRRPRHVARHPVHVTQRIAGGVLLDAGLRTLRRRDAYRIVRRAFVHGCQIDTRGGKFRICQYSVQRDHIHLIVEADSESALARGMQGFAIRVARGINRFLGRTGRVFDDRYHAQPVTSPRQARNALSYVLLNAHKHGEHVGAPLDPFSSACHFDGFLEATGPPAGSGHRADLPVAAAQTWLLCIGWRRHGLISLFEKPGRGRRQSGR